MNYRLALRLPLSRLARPGPRVARRVESRAGRVRIIVEVQDLPPGRASSYTVASYVRAVLKLQALHRDFAQAALELARCKRTLAGRRQADSLLAERQQVLRELGVEAEINVDHATP